MALSDDGLPYSRQLHERLPTDVDQIARDGRSTKSLHAVGKEALQGLAFKRQGSAESGCGQGR
ncbi:MULTISPECIES: hypothetical protein [unclassified Variovorax]|uniref:hypothetical protein n=1 Tax=unclassified Variovorax TaxID=663243 RepID=UPI0011601B1D|nr:MULTISPECIES: hypothetical protein [unclassified Variovorax]